MIISIAHPVGFSRIGGRANNEDAIYPLENEATNSNKLFVVCDGIGGHNSGEIASRLASIEFANYLHAHPELDNPRSDEEIYQSWSAALRETENSFEEYMATHPESSGMGTTLCFLHVHTSGITLGHIGDSRIYQIRENKIIFRTEDHSIVNQLLRAGQITPEEARNYPAKNVITRAIQGAKRPSEIEFDLITDLQENDYFFICTDGVLEQISDRILEEVFSAPDYSLQERARIIIEKCQNLTRDNFSAYLIEIKQVLGEPLILPSKETKNDQIHSITYEEEYDVHTAEKFQELTDEDPKERPQPTKIKKTKDIFLGLIYALGAGIILLFGYLTYDYFFPGKKTVKDETVPNLDLSTSPEIKKDSVKHDTNTTPDVAPAAVPTSKPEKQKTKTKPGNKVTKPQPGELRDKKDSKKEQKEQKTEDKSKKEDSSTTPQGSEPSSQPSRKPKEKNQGPKDN